MKTSTLLNRVDTRLAACAAAASASLAIVPSSDADIIWSGPISITIPSTTAGVYLNVVSGVSAISPAGAPGWDINPFSSTTLNMFNPAAPTGGVYVGVNGFYNLSFGPLISAASPFSSGTLSATSPNPLFFNSSNNIIGFRFQNEAQGNQIQYGWFRISLSGTVASQPRMIVEYAYDNTGAPILAGVLDGPEPSTYALLSVAALGALGVRAWRRRKAA
jgi:hypothetical protein